MARKREKERPSPEDCLVAFKAERKARHVGDRCIVTRTNEIPFARASAKQDEAGHPKAQLVPRHSFQAHERSALSSLVPLSPSLARIYHPLPVIRFLPTGGMNEDGRSQPRFGHATSCRTEASFLHSLCL